VNVFVRVPESCNISVVVLDAHGSLAKYLFINVWKVRLDDGIPAGAFKPGIQPVHRHKFICVLSWRVARDTLPHKQRAGAERRQDDKPVCN